MHPIAYCIPEGTVGCPSCGFVAFIEGRDVVSASHVPCLWLPSQIISYWLQVFGSKRPSVWAQWGIKCFSTMSWGGTENEKWLKQEIPLPTRNPRGVASWFLYLLVLFLDLFSSGHDFLMVLCDESLWQEHVSQKAQWWAMAFIYMLTSLYSITGPGRHKSKSVKLQRSTQILYYTSEDRGAWVWKVNSQRAASSTVSRSTRLIGKCGCAKTRGTHSAGDGAAGTMALGKHAVKKSLSNQTRVYTQLNAEVRFQDSLKCWRISRFCCR